jgi:hypothetical protein
MLLSNVSYKILVGNSSRNTPLGRSRQRSKNNSTVFRYIEYDMWTGFTWLRVGNNDGALVNAVMNLRLA